MLPSPSADGARWSRLRLAGDSTRSTVSGLSPHISRFRIVAHEDSNTTNPLPNCSPRNSISLNTMTLSITSPKVYTQQGVPISVTGIAQVKIQGQNMDMLRAACEQFLGKTEEEIKHVAQETLEGHQRAIMASMSVEEIYKNRKKFSKKVFEVASSDLVDMGFTVVSYTIKDISDEEGYLHALGTS